MYTTSELIEQVRAALHEYDESPITNTVILRKLQLAYTFAFNSLIKQNTSLFSEWKYITTKQNVSYYPLPKDSYNRRIEKLYAPVPIMSPNEPITWTEIQRCTPEVIPRFQSAQLQVYYPIRWTQLGEHIIIAPTPNMGSVFRVLYTPYLVPLGIVQGQIVDISGNVITLDRSPDAEMASSVSRRGYNVLSISDEMSGKVKAVYPFSEINGYDVYLSDNFNRDTIREKKIRKAYTLNPATRIDYDPLTKECTILTNTDAREFLSVGGVFEVLRPASGSYNITDSLEDADNFYDPPEYTLPGNTFSPSATVTKITANSLSWIDSTVVPDFVGGYPQGYDATYTGPINSLAAGLISANPVIIMNTGSHRLKAGVVYKLSITGTGTTIDGTRKCVVVNPTQIAVLLPSFSGTFTAGGTWAILKYSSLVVDSGWPEIYSVSPGTPKADMISLYSGTPFTYSSLPERSSDTPDEDYIVGTGMTGVYDHSNDVRVGDWVTLGYSTAVPLHSDLISELLVFYCSLTLKSAINENDPEMLAILKEKVSELLSDTDGRDIHLEMEQQAYRGVSMTRRGRR